MKFVLIFVFSIFYVNLFAADMPPTFYVSNPTMVNAYFDIFNGIVALISSETYKNLLRMVFTLGGFIVFTMGIFKVIQGGDSKTPVVDFTKYMISGSAILTLLYGGTNGMTPMIVQSEVMTTTSCPSDPQHPAITTAFTVNMPEILVYTFSGINNMGREMTLMAASAFSSISTDSVVSSSLVENSMAGIGKNIEGVQTLMSSNLGSFYRSDLNITSFGSGSVWGEANPSVIASSYIQSFWSDCVFMSGSSYPGDSKALVTALTESGHMVQTLDDDFGSATGAVTDPKTINSYSDPLLGNIKQSYALQSNPALYQIEFNNINGTCHEFYTSFIRPIINPNSTQALCNATAIDKLSPAAMYLMTKNGDVAQDSKTTELVTQSAIMQSFSESYDQSKVANGIGYASGRSNAQFILNNVGTGAYMAKMIPYLQMGIRAILYAFFPFVFVVIMFPGGFAVLKSYAESMLWVELWSPVAAILNMFLNYFQMDTMNASYNEGFDFAGSTKLLTDANMLSAVAGYLYMSVPALTWLILKGSAQMLGSISGGMASSFSQNMSSETANIDKQNHSAAQKFNHENNTKLSLSEFMALEATQAGNQRGVGTWSDQDSYSNSQKFQKAQQQGSGDVIASIGDKGVRNASYVSTSSDILASQKSVDAYADQHGLKGKSEQEKRSAYIEAASGAKAQETRLQIAGTEDLMKKLSTNGKIDPSKVERFKAGENINSIVNSETANNTAKILGDGNTENGMKKWADGKTQDNVANTSFTHESNSDKGYKVEALKLMKGQIDKNPIAFSSEFKNKINNALNDKHSTSDEKAKFSKDYSEILADVKGSTELTSQMSSINLQEQKTKAGITLAGENSYQVNNLQKSMSEQMGSIKGTEAAAQLALSNANFDGNENEAKFQRGILAQFKKDPTGAWIKEAGHIADLSTQSSAVEAQGKKDSIVENLKANLGTAEQSRIGTAQTKQKQSELKELTRNLSTSNEIVNFKDEAVTDKQLKDPKVLKEYQNRALNFANDERIKNNLDPKTNFSDLDDSEKKTFLNRAKSGDIKLSQKVLKEAVKMSGGAANFNKLSKKDREAKMELSSKSVLGTFKTDSDTFNSITNNEVKDKLSKAGYSPTDVANTQELTQATNIEKAKILYDTFGEVMDDKGIAKTVAMGESAIKAIGVYKAAKFVFNDGKKAKDFFTKTKDFKSMMKDDDSKATFNNLYDKTYENVPSEAKLSKEDFYGKLQNHKNKIINEVNTK